MTHAASWRGARAGLYIHVPFCSAICPYCDFAVLVGGPSKRASFVELMGLELDRLTHDGTLAGPLAGPYDTLYLGGGTPSLFGTDQLDAMLDRVRASVRVAHDARLFLEINPEDVTAHQAADWRALGVTNVSLGVQSFEDEELRFLGRRHGGAQARAAVETLLAADFESVSFDLIYGLPDQDLDAWAAALDRAARLSPHHLSCYQLTIEPGTPFGQRQAGGTLVPPLDEALGTFFTITHERLADAGYEGYEVSNFARAPAFRSAHNQKYWHHVPYLGLGPSAHSFDGRTRWWNERHLARYARQLRAGRSPIAEREQPDAEQRALEALMLGLRTIDGLDVQDIRERHGIDLVAGNEARIDRMQRDGLMHDDVGRLRLTLAGRAVVEGLVARWQLTPVDAS